MNPNENQPQQQSGGGAQPPPPNAQFGQPQVTGPQQGNPYGPQPTVQQPKQPQAFTGGDPVTQPYQTQQNQQFSQQGMSSRELTGHKLLFVGRIIGLITVLIAVIIVVVLHFMGNSVNKNLSNLNKTLQSTTGSSGSSSSSTSGTSTSSATTSKTACDLYTLSDAQTVMDSSATATNGSSAPITGPDNTTSLCNYSDTNSTIASVDLSVSVWSSQSNASKTFASEQSTAGSTSSVSGVGDKAFYDSNGQTLYVLKGDVILAISCVDQSGNASQQTDQQVANTMISNF